MDDVFGMLPSWMFTAIVAVVVLVIIGIIFARLYRRASAEQAFVRNCHAYLPRNHSYQHEHPQT